MRCLRCLLEGFQPADPEHTHGDQRQADPGEGDRKGCALSDTAAGHGSDRIRSDPRKGICDHVTHLRDKTDKAPGSSLNFARYVDPHKVFKGIVGKSH